MTGRGIELANETVYARNVDRRAAGFDSRRRIFPQKGTVATNATLANLIVVSP